MNDTGKIRKIGGSAAPSPLSVSTLVKFAEAIIRSDKEVALRSQHGVTDLVAPSQDSREKGTVRPSSLESLCGKPGNVKIQRTEDEHGSSPVDNIVSFGSRNKKS